MRFSFSSETYNSHSLDLTSSAQQFKEVAMHPDVKIYPRSFQFILLFNKISLLSPEEFISTLPSLIGNLQAASLLEGKPSREKSAQRSESERRLSSESSRLWKHNFLLTAQLWLFFLKRETCLLFYTDGRSEQPVLVISSEEGCRPGCVRRKSGWTSVALSGFQGTVKFSFEYEQL